jgi:DNA-binding NarL/FixJ family response regulator
MTTITALPNRSIARLDTVTNWLMVAIVAIPFVISAGSLTVLAAENYVSFPLLYPLMIDGGLLIFKALALRSSLHGRRDWYSWGAAATLTGISVLLNVLHVPESLPSVWLARFMAALPPLLILTAFVAISRRVEETAQAQGVQMGVARLAQEREVLHTAVSLLRTEQAELDTAVAAKRTELRQLVQEGHAYLDKLQGQIGMAEAKVARLQQSLTALPSTAVDKGRGAELPPVTQHGGDMAGGMPREAGADKLAERRKLVQTFTHEGVSVEGIAARLGVSVKTVRRDLKAMSNE